MSQFFETAQAIGARLCREAIWAGGRCNWVGASMEGLAGWTVVQKSFGPDLYSGTSGIGILLAELARFNNEGLFRRTAEGAAAQALSRLEDIPAPMRLGFYSGHSGIAYAVIRIGECLGNQSLVEQGRAVMGKLHALDPGEQGIDVVSGVAGAIPALLLMHKKFKTQDLLDMAHRCALRLEQTANRGAHGWSWKTIEPTTPLQPDLTGFSHGTAGIGWALLEMNQAVGEARFRLAAEEAFRYERHWFNGDHGNWPDFRGGTGDSGPSAPSYSVAWCHGAPGIALSRLRAFELTHDNTCAEEAKVAAKTTARYLGIQQNGQAGFSLCHGIAGNADILLEAARVLNSAECRQSAEAAGHQGIALFESQRAPWPCGVLGGGETPNLLLGAAGIGLFYLRLDYANKVAPVLQVGPGSEVT